MRVNPSIRSPRTVTPSVPLSRCSTVTFSSVSRREAKQIFGRPERRERAQIEAVQAAARSHKREKKVAELPLSAETLRPLLEKMVKEGIEHAIGPMLHIMGRQDKRWNAARGTSTSEKNVLLVCQIFVKFLKIPDNSAET